MAPSKRSAQLGSRPTLKSIAERTGLAITTVSKALRGDGNFSAETIERIHKVADEIGYRPNRSGVGLRTGRTYTITVAFDHSDDISDFERQIVSGVASELSKTRYELSLTPIFPGMNEVELFRSIAMLRRADGIVFTNTAPQDARARLLTELGFPFVTHGRTTLAKPHPFYDFDNETFAYLAAMRLAQKGRKRLAFATGSPGLTYFDHAMAGFERAHEEAGVEVSRLEPIPGNQPYAARLHEAVTRAVRAGNLPEGIVSSSDVGTLAIVDALIGAGVIVGRDIDIVSRKTSSILDFCRPRVDTVSEDLTEAGRIMARFLVDSIDGRPAEDLQLIGAPRPSWALQ